MNDPASDGDDIVLEDEGPPLAPLHERGVAGTRRRVAKRTEAAKELRELALGVKADLGSMDDLGPTWRAVCLIIGQRILTGEIPVNNAREAKAVSEVAHNIARLEDNQATTIGEIRTPEQREQLRRELEQKARGELIELPRADAG